MPELADTLATRQLGVGFGGLAGAQLAAVAELGRLEVRLSPAAPPRRVPQIGELESGEMSMARVRFLPRILPRLPASPP